MNTEEKIILVETLQKIKTDAERRKHKKIEGFWKEAGSSRNLKSFLSSLTKADLDNIRKNLELKNISKLKKQALIEALVELIPMELKNTINTFDLDRYQVIKNIYDEGGFITLEKLPLSIEEIQFYREHGLVFPGLDKGQQGLFMPKELQKAFEAIDGTLEKNILQNEEWIKLTKGALFYYGIVKGENLLDIVLRENKESKDSTEYLRVLEKTVQYHKEIRRGKKGYFHYSVGSSELLLQQQEKRSNVGYYPFTKEQLLKAGESGYVEHTPQTQGFIDFINKYYQPSLEEAEEILHQCITLIKTSGDHKIIIDYLQDCLNFSNIDVAQQLVKKAMDVYNNTRMWELKGHTPVEVSQLTKDLKHLATDNFTINQQTDKVIDFNKRRKVGRNQLCPCGSNKKYKKCCGK